MGTPCSSVTPYLASTHRPTVQINKFLALVQRLLSVALLMYLAYRKIRLVG